MKSVVHPARDPGVENPCLERTTVLRTGHVRPEDACFFQPGTFSARLIGTDAEFSGIGFAMPAVGIDFPA